MKVRRYESEVWEIMDDNQVLNTQYNEQELQRAQAIQTWKERIYRFFYNIWPGINRVLQFFFYHLLRIIKGFFKIAMEEFRNK